MRRRLVAGLLLATACSRIGEPPGGPPDTAAPVLLGTVPESLAVLPDFDGDAAFLFDETVNEGTRPNFGIGTGDLEKLVLLSPTTDVPVVRWRRSRITVKPKEGWQPNRVYRIELLPGVNDLRNNRTRTGRVITFTTGAPYPGLVLTGRVVDWTTGRPEPLGLIEAVLEPDSLVYRTAADSSGRFELGPLPDGVFLVSGILDQNKNRRLDRRESYDTVRVALGQDSVGEIWAFRHDTVPARIQSLTRSDSVSITVAFNQHLNPYQRLQADSVRVRELPDSTDLTVLAILPKSAYDSLYAARPAPSDSAATDSVAADSVAQLPDSAAVDSVPPALAAPEGQEPVPRDTTDRGPLTTKPLLYDRLVIRVTQTLEPGTSYIVEVNGLENANRVAGTAFLGFQVPEQQIVAPADSAAADSTAADSLGVPGSVNVVPDSLNVVPDSLNRRPDSVPSAVPDTAARDSSGLRRRRSRG